MKNLILTLCILVSIETIAQTEPFTKRTVISGLNKAWEVVYGPNDSLWVTENSAYLISRVNVANGVKTVLNDLRATDGTINFTSAGQQPQGGLMGLAIHPNLYSTNPAVRAAKPWVYAAYVYERNSCPGTNTSCIFTTKIVRFTYNGNTLSSPTIVLDNIPGSSDHNSGRLVIGPTIESGSDAAHTQYRLYYTVGDMGAGQFLNTTRAENAQVLDNLEGKVLRINTDVDGDAGLDAWVPNDNPFYTAATITPRDYVFSMGHRNAQGLAWGNVGGTNFLFSSEQQDRSDDEINIIESGKNYGWDKVTGYCEGNVNGFKIGQTTNPNEQTFCSGTPTYREPIYSTWFASAASMGGIYADGNNANWPTIASSSIAFYSPNQIPGWNKCLLVSSLKQDKVYRMKPNAAGTGLVALPNGMDTISYFRGDGNRIRRITIHPGGIKFYVARDAGTIMEYTYTGVTLASHFTYVDGKMIRAGVAEISWEATTDELHDHFEIERSNSQGEYTNLGRSVSAPPYVFTDATIQPGNNYYRIKQVDKDGKSIYSKEVLIINDPSRPVINFYPNPAHDHINVSVSTSRNTNINIILTDLIGKKVYQHSSVLNKGTTEIKVDLHNTQDNIYILSVTDKEGTVLVTQKILKN